MPKQASMYNNALLKAFDIGLISRLGLKHINFKCGQIIELPGTPIKNLYFLETGMASMTTLFSDGTEVEVGMFGHESVIGVSALMGTKTSLNIVYTQIEGDGYSCDVAVAQKEFDNT